MKNTLFLLLIFISFVSWISPVDIGFPSINAICKIKFKNGTTTEGILCIVNGGYAGFRKNGFGNNYTGTEYFQYRLFTLDHYTSDLHSSSRNNRKTGERQYSELYYMASQYDQGTNQVSSLDSNTMEHSLSFSTEYKYLALKEFYIYQELPLSLYLPIENDKTQSQDTLQQKRTLISVDSIDRFELIQNPSDQWLKIIDRARVRRKNSNQDWEDYQEPLWYHEISNDSILFEKIKMNLGDERTPCSYRK